MFDCYVTTRFVVLRLIVTLARAVLCCIRLLRYFAMCCVVFDVYVSARCLELNCNCFVVKFLR